MMMPVQVNEVYAPYLSDDTRTQIFFGGSSSGKSFFLAQRTVIDVLQGRNYLITRKVARDIRRSVFNEILKAIESLEQASAFSVNKSDMTITCKRNLSQILFAGLDDVEKLKSITPIKGVVTDIWVEEATEITYDDYKPLVKRLRGLSTFQKRVTLSFNPIFKQHWIFEEFFADKWDDSSTYYHDDRLSIIKTTYKDNAFLSPEDVRELLSEKDQYYYNVYTLGNFGILGDVIFNNWHIEDLSERSKQFDRIYYGVDFGFSPDPWAMVCVHYEQSTKQLFVFDEAGGLEVPTETIADEIYKRAGRKYVSCDAANKRTINDLRTMGVNARSVKKGADSIQHGIKWLQEREIIIDPSCRSLINEMQVYHYGKDHNGIPTGKPAKTKAGDHYIDALRYACESEMSNRTIKAGQRLF